MTFTALVSVADLLQVPFLQKNTGLALESRAWGKHLLLPRGVRDQESIFFDLSPWEKLPTLIDGLKTTKT